MTQSCPYHLIREILTTQLYLHHLMREILRDVINVQLSLQHLMRNRYINSAINVLWKLIVPNNLAKRWYEVHSLRECSKQFIFDVWVRSFVGGFSRGVITYTKIISKTQLTYMGHSKSFMITISPTYLFIWKKEFVWVSVQLSGVLSGEIIPSTLPMKITWPGPPVGRIAHGLITITQKKMWT